MNQGASQKLGMFLLLFAVEVFATIAIAQMAQTGRLFVQKGAMALVPCVFMGYFLCYFQFKDYQKARRIEKLKHRQWYEENGFLDQWVEENARWEKAEWSRQHKDRSETRRLVFWAATFLTMVSIGVLSFSETSVIGKSFLLVLALWAAASFASGLRRSLRKRAREQEGELVSERAPDAAAGEDESEKGS